MEEIADMLEEETELIQKICDVAEQYASEYDVEAVWRAYDKQNNRYNE